MEVIDNLGTAYTILIRKWDINNNKHIAPNKKNINKQIKTLHRKMKKADNKIYTYYSIEKDDDRNTYHTHLLVYTNNIGKIKDVLKKYISGYEWLERINGTRVFDECNSKFGLVHVEQVIDIEKYIRYISKKNEYNILY